MQKNTANRILDTATSLFAAFGFEKVTIKQLAQTANINSAAISYYFGGKENLYQEVLSKQFSPALQSLQELNVSCQLTATECLHNYAEMMAAVKRMQPYLTSLWQYEMNRYEDGQNSFIVKEYTIQLYLSIFSALSHGISQNEFLPDLDPFSTASVLLELLHAPYIPASLLTEPAVSGKNICKAHSVQAIHHFLRGIRRGPL